MSDLVGNFEDWFSRVTAHTVLSMKGDLYFLAWWDTSSGSLTLNE